MAAQAPAVQEFIAEYFGALDSINKSFPREKIEQAADLLYQTWERGGTVYIIGNGGSASTATHFASDLAKFSMVKGKKRLKVLSMVDNIPLVSAWANDSGFGTIYAEQLDPWLKEGDLLIGISVHGGSSEDVSGPWSQNIGQAIELARKRGAKVLGLSGFGGGALGKKSDVSLVVPLDSEPLGTPLVEAYHVVLHHLIASLLHLRIKGGSDGSHI